MVKNFANNKFEGENKIKARNTLTKEWLHRVVKCLMVLDIKKWKFLN